MMENIEKSHEELDEFELALKEKLSTLQECQKSNNLESCLNCDKILSCEIREIYIKAVYMSMNKGVTGGFEF